MTKRWDERELLDLLAEAGRMALDCYDCPSVELKSDRSVVTAADREIEAFLARHFDRPAAGDYLIGEETLHTRSRNYLEKALAGRAYVVDPIDGTAPYTVKLPVWGVSIGLVEQGRMTEGAIYLPVDDEAIYTFEGGVRSCRNLQRGNRRSEALAVVPPLAGRDGHLCVAQRYARQAVFTLPNQLFCFSSCIGAFYYMLKGRFAGYLGHFKLWDIAGSYPVMERLGFAAEFFGGGRFTADVAACFDLDFASPHCWEPKDCLIMTADPALVDHVRRHVRFPARPR